MKCLPRRTRPVCRMGLACLILAAALTGCAAKKGPAGTSSAESTAPSSHSSAHTASPSSAVPTAYTATEEERTALRRTLRNFVLDLKRRPGEYWDMLYWDDYDKLTADSAYDSLQVLGKSNGWYVCLWREGPPDQRMAGEKFGRYVVLQDISYYPEPLGLYFIKGDEVLWPHVVIEQKRIDAEAVYHMLPADMQSGLYAEVYPTGDIEYTLD